MTWIERLPRRTVRRVTIGLGVLLLGAAITIVTAGALQAYDTIDRLSAQAARRSPSTDYTAAVNATDECRSTIRDAFLAHVAYSVTLSGAPEDPVRQQAVAEAILYDEALLRQIAEVCPYPTPPRYTADGDLIAPSTGGVATDELGRPLFPPIPNLGQVLLPGAPQIATTPSTLPPTRPRATTTTTRPPPATTAPQEPGTTTPTTTPTTAPPATLLPPVPLPQLPCSLFVPPLLPPGC